MAGVPWLTLLRRTLQGLIRTRGLGGSIGGFLNVSGESIFSTEDLFNVSEGLLRSVSEGALDVSEGFRDVSEGFLDVSDEDLFDLLGYKPWPSSFRVV